MNHFVMKAATASSQADSQEISLNSNDKEEETIDERKSTKLSTLALKVWIYPEHRINCTDGHYGYE
jgi:hypothetical protein